MFALLFNTYTISAQENKALPGAMFIELQSNARDAGMGGVHNISQESALGVFSNPSANLFSEKNIGVGTSLSATDDFSGNKLFALGSFYNFNTNHSVSLGLRYFNYPSIDIIDTKGNHDGAFSPNEMTIDLGYGYLINDNLSISITGRFINSDLGSYNDAKSSNAFAGDLGITYSSELESIDGGNISVALAASNFGTKLKYLEEELAMPSLVKLGASLHTPFNDNHKLTGTVNIGHRVLPSNFSATELGVGAEYNLYQHGFLRAGYHLSNKTKGYGNFTTVGAGINFDPISIDVAYWIGVNEKEYKNTVFINLSATF